MNRSLYYIIPILIALIGLIAWFFKCPWCILLPLLFSLGSAYLGWRMGLSDGDKRIGRLEGDVSNYKSQLAVANQTPVARKDSDEAEWKSKYTALNTEKNRLNQEWEGRLSTMKLDYEKKLLNLNTEKTNLLSQVGSAAREVVREVEVIKEVPVEVIKEVPIEVIKEVEVVKFAEGVKEDGKWKAKYKALKQSFDGELSSWKTEKAGLLERISQAPSEVIREIEVIKEVPVIKEIEVVREVPIEIIKEVEVVKSIDMDSLEEMMTSMSQQEVYRTEKSGISLSSKSSSRSTDDLTKIDGIGTAVSKLLSSNGITTFKALSKLKKSALLGILDKGGKRFRMINPKSWSAQAKLASKGDWKGLKKLQEKDK